MAVLQTTHLQVLLLLLSFFAAVWCSKIQVSGIGNEVVILSGNQSVSKSLTLRRVSGIHNRVTIALAETATIAPGVECGNVNISSIDGIDNRVSITAIPPDGLSGRCSNINISSIDGIDNRVSITAIPPDGESGGYSNINISRIDGIHNHVSIIASPDGQSGGYSNINISRIDGIHNTVIIVSGASVTLEDIAATLSRYNSYRFPAESCSAVVPAISGYYWIGRRSPKRVYCAFDPPHCGGEGVWRRMANIDTNVQNVACPGNFTLVQSGSQAYCSSTSPSNCVLAQFSSLSSKEVCGVAHITCSNGTDCSGDKLEFQYSTRYPRKQEKLWAYSIATSSTSTCSCATNDSYCTPKCWYPNYPWFRKVLPKSVSGTLELQLCLDEDNEALAVDLAEIYIREDQ